MAKKNNGVKLRFDGVLGTINIDKFNAIKLGNVVLSGIAESNAIDKFKICGPMTVAAGERDLLEGLMIQILEEKFGLKIRICGNCKSYSKENQGCAFLTMPDHFVNFGDTCKGKDGSAWAPLKISEKK